jgi:hypothetical protein
MPSRLNPANTGVVDLGNDVVDAARTYQSQAITQGAPSLQLDPDHPEPVTLFVSVSGPMDRNNDPAGGELFLGFPDALAGVSAYGSGMAGLVVQYGVGSVSRVVAFDLRPGSYQLPACSYVKTSIIAYRDGAPGFLSRSVGVTLVPGFVHPTPTRATVTCGLNISGPGPGAEIGFTAAVPAQARWVDIFADMPTGVAPADADAPQLRLRPASATPGRGGPSIDRDYVNEIYTPNWGPVELAAPVGQLLEFAQVNAACAADVRFWGRFWLEL